MSSSILQLLVSFGLGTIIVTIINAIMNRRKLSAEATEIITKAAAGTVENIMKDNGELRERMAKMEAALAEARLAIAAAEMREREHQTADQRWRWHIQRWHTYACYVKDNPGTNIPMPPLWPDEPPRVAVDPNIEEV